MKLIPVFCERSGLLNILNLINFNSPEQFEHSSIQGRFSIQISWTNSGIKYLEPIQVSNISKMQLSCINMICFELRMNYRTHL